MDPHKASLAFARFGDNYPSSSTSFNVFNEIYTVLIPELPIYHGYKILCSSGRRDVCLRGEECSRERMQNTNRFLVI